MHTLVLGSGRSALSAAKLLAHHGTPTVVSDIPPGSDAAGKILKSLDIAYVVGPQTRALLNQVERIVVSPGIDPTTEIIKHAKASAIPIISEVDLALQYYHGAWIAVTGTNGKSTTTVMIEHLLRQAGLHAIAGGNLGRPACDIVLSESRIDVLVLELSSYQIEYSSDLAPQVAVFTSFTPDHLARHLTLERYFSTKWRLFSSRTRHRIITDEVWRFAVQNGDDLEGVQVVEPLNVKSSTYRPLHAKHDRSNAACAIAAASAVHPLTRDQYLSFFHNFCGLDFRFQRIGFNGTKPIINDSKATNVASTLVALESVESPAIILLGGRAKGESFAPILVESKKIKLVIAFGEAAESIDTELGRKLKVIRYPTLHAALSDAACWLSRDTMVLFSPACASFDEFSDFEDRGRFFTKAMTQSSG